MPSESQKKREEAMKAANAQNEEKNAAESDVEGQDQAPEEGEGETPAWKEQQQKETTAKDNEDRAQEKKAGKQVKIKMKSDYRDVAKKGDVWKTDPEKAEELVRLGRAEYVK